MVASSPDSLHAWLERLHRARIVELTPRVVEQCTNVVALRTTWSPEDLADSLASLLAHDETGWRLIRAHFLETFDCPMRGADTGPTSAPQPCSPTPPRPPRLSPRTTPAKPRPRDLRRVGLLLVVVCAGYIAGPAAIRWLGRCFDPLAPESDTRAEIAKLVNDVVLPSDYGRELEHSPSRTAIETRAASPPELPGPWWLRGALLALMPLLAMLAVRWWQAVADHRAAMAALDRRATELRRQAQFASTELCEPYHLERAPPFALTQADDAATILGRLTHTDSGVDFDAPRTIDRTIIAGGRVELMFDRGGLRDVPVVLVDVEDGHPWRDGVEHVLERWRRGGLLFDRYDFSWEPSNLRRWPDNQPYDLDTLARRASDRPLILFSRMLRPRDLHRKLEWLMGLHAWPARAWIDLDPRVAAERTDATFGEICQSLRRFPWTADGLVFAARYLVSGGRDPNPIRERALPPVLPDMLALWAACAALVPDPSWAQLEAIRLALPELREAIPDARQVQQLLAWANRIRLGGGRRDYLLGSGTNLVMDPQRRGELLVELRQHDAARFTHDTDKIEYRAREALLRQLEVADTRDDRFSEELRQVKMAFHRAVITREQADALLLRFAGRPAARELKRLLAEELALQHRGYTLGGGWAPDTYDTLSAFSRGASRALLIDLIRPGRWSAAGLARAAAAALVGLACGYAWWSSESGQASEEVVMTRVVEMPATWKVRPGLCEVDALTALADVRPMCLVPIPAGKFTMGSHPSEPGRDPDETTHKAAVGALAIGTHEVTRAQWIAVMGPIEEPCMSGCGDQHPMTGVRWYDACVFMIALTHRENALRRARGKPEMTQCYTQSGESCNWTNLACTGFRLPTETEWEYAARAGSTTAYSYGDDASEMCAYGNGADRTFGREHPNWDDARNRELLGPLFGCDDGYPDVAPVGKLLPNAWGLHDMHGNVWEWTWDWYAENHDPGATALGYTGPASGTQRVMRGGSCWFRPGGMRSANRDHVVLSYRSQDIGLRCVRGLLPGELAE